MIVQRAAEHFSSSENPTSFPPIVHVTVSVSGPSTSNWAASSFLLTSFLLPSWFGVKKSSVIAPEQATNAIGVESAPFASNGP